MKVISLATPNRLNNLVTKLYSFLVSEEMAKDTLPLPKWQSYFYELGFSTHDGDAGELMIFSLNCIKITYRRPHSPLERTRDFRSLDDLTRYMQLTFKEDNETAAAKLPSKTYPDVWVDS